MGYGLFVVAELAEAASRTGEEALVRSALEWLSQRTHVTSSDWLLGIEARVRALLGEADGAERDYRESIECLGRTRLRWSWRAGICSTGSGCAERSGVSTRASSCAPHSTCSARSARTASPSGRDTSSSPPARRSASRRDDTRDELTPQEEHIARLALAGRTNPEIGAELFISSRTVEWHLKKVFMKLGISSRKGLPDALPARGDPVVAA